MIWERTKVGLDAVIAEGRIGGRRSKLRKDQRKDIADNVISGRKSGADMAMLYNVSEATNSRIVAAHRQLLFQECYTTLGTFMGLDPT